MVQSVHRYAALLLRVVEDFVVDISASHKPLSLQLTTVA
jgi:hypothetical protein